MLTALRVLTGASVTLSLVSFGVADASGPLALTLAGVGLTGYGVTEWTRAMGRGVGIPRVVSNVVLLAALAVSLLRAWGHRADLVTIFAGFLSTLIVLRVWEQRRLRDYAHLLLMSLFLGIGAVLTGTSLGVGLTIMAITPLLCLGAMVYHVCGAEQRASGREFDEVPARAGRAVLTGTLVGTAGLSLLMGFAFAVAAFILVPRTDLGPLVGFRFGGQAGGRVTGFASEVDLTTGGLISESQATVMTVRVRSADLLTDRGSEQRPLYLRGAVLEDYQGGRWKASEEWTPPAPWGQGQTLPIRIAVGSSREGESAEVSLRDLPPGSSPLFMVGHPGGVTMLDCTGVVMVQYDPRTLAVRRSDSGGPLRYRAYTDSEPAETLAPEERGRYLGFGVSRVRAIAAELLHTAGMEPDPELRGREGDASVVRYFENYLRTRFRYTLNPIPGPSFQDPTEHFLLTGREGHCEYFASALAGLCRGVGIPARVITGYMSGEYDAGSGTYTVRQSHAHAWVEAYVGGGWREYDGTPPSQVSTLQASRRGLMGRMAGWLDRLEDRWNTSVVAFDRAAQSRILGVRAHETWLDLVSERVRSVLSWPSEHLGAGGWNWGEVLRWGLRALAGVALLGAIGIGARRRRRGRAKVSGWALDRAQRGLYNDLWKQVARAGVRKPSLTPGGVFVEELRRTRPELARECEVVLGELAAARYGGGRVDRAGIRSRIRGIGA